MGAYLQFEELAKLEPAIRRQNTRVAGLIVGKYHVFDIVGRLSRGGQVPLQLVFDYCWNTEIDENNKGLWLAAVMGATGVSRGQLEYTYAKVDKDATLAAYNTDDFFWGTGWEAHRVRPRPHHEARTTRPRHRPVAALQGQPRPGRRASSG